MAAFRHIGLLPTLVSLSVHDKDADSYSSQLFIEERTAHGSTRAAILLSEWSKSRRLDVLVATAKRWRAMRLFVGGGTPFVELSSTQAARLRRILRPEVEALETILNRDLSAWK